MDIVDYIELNEPLTKSSGFFGGVVDNIKNFFGIKSPSRKMANLIGKPLAQTEFIVLKNTEI